MVTNGSGMVLAPPSARDRCVPGLLRVCPPGSGLSQLGVHRPLAGHGKINTLACSYRCSTAFIVHACSPILVYFYGAGMVRREWPGAPAIKPKNEEPFGKR